MASRAPRKPLAIKLDNTTARAIRGPHKDGSGRWYWRADLYVEGQRRRETVWSGWASRDDARREVSRLLSVRNPREAAREERDARRSDVQTVRDLLEVYMGAQEARVAIWRREEEAGEAAVARGAAVKVEHSRDALSKNTFEPRRSSARHVVRALGTLRLRHVTTDVMQRYVAVRLESGAPGSVRNEITTIKAAWAWASRDGRDYTKGIEVTWPQVLATPVREKYTPTREEVERANAQMPDGWQRDVIKVQSILGCRIGALARLPRRDVNLARGTVRLKVKNHDRTVKVPDDVMDVLRPWVEAAEEHGTIWGVSPATVKNVMTVRKGRPTHWAKACAAASVQRFSSHGLRRLVSNEWIAAGVNVAVYARVLGHSPEEALRSYAAVQGADEAAAFQLARSVQQTNVVTLDRRHARNT